MHEGRPSDPRASSGQASVEYALVLLAFIASVAAMAAVWHAASDGALVELSARSSSHSLGSGSPVAEAKDLFLY